MAAAGATPSLAINSNTKQSAEHEIQGILANLYLDDRFRISLNDAYLRFSMLTPKLREVRLHLTILHLNWYQEIINYHHKPNKESLSNLYKIIKSIYLSQNEYFVFQNKPYKTMAIRKYFKAFMAILNKKKYDLHLCIVQFHAIQDLLEVMQNLHKGLSEAKAAYTIPNHEFKFASCLKNYIKVASYIEINRMHDKANILQEKISELTLRIPHFLFSSMVEDNQPILISVKEFAVRVPINGNAVYEKKLLHLQTTQYYTRFLVRNFTFAKAKFLPALTVLFTFQKEFFQKAVAYLINPQQSNIKAISDVFCRYLQETHELLDIIDYAYVKAPFMQITKEVTAVFEAHFRGNNERQVKILIELFIVLTDKATNLVELARTNISSQVPLSPNQQNIIDKLKHCEALESKLTQEYNAISNVQIIDMFVEPFNQLMDALDEKNRDQQIAIKKLFIKVRAQPLVFSTTLSGTSSSSVQCCSSSSSSNSKPHKYEHR